MKAAVDPVDEEALFAASVLRSKTSTLLGFGSSAAAAAAMAAAAQAADDTQGADSGSGSFARDSDPPSKDRRNGDMAIGETSGVPSLTAPRRTRRYGLALVSLAAALLASLTVFTQNWRPAPPVEGELQSGRSGTRLHLSCENCPDGSKASLSGAQASFKDGAAEIPVSKELHVGTNLFEVQIERTGLGRDETVSLKVPVHFLIQPDMSQLNAGALGVTIQVETGASVEVDGKPMKLEAGAGKATFPLTQEVQNALNGHSSFSHDFDFVVAHKNWTGRTTFTVQAPMTEVVLEAPMPRPILEKPEFTVAGITAPGAQLSIAGTEVPVAEDGHFSQMLSVAGLGATPIELKATAPGAMPRRIVLDVLRVSDRHVAARDLFGKALRGYTEVRALLEAGKASTVALSARIQDQQSTAFSTTLLASVATGCELAPCLVRIRVGLPRSFKVGQQVSVFGEAQRLVSAPLGGAAIPEIESRFLLP